MSHCKPCLKGWVGQTLGVALIDSGNVWHDIMSLEMWRKMGKDKDDLLVSLQSIVGTAREGADLTILGQCPEVLTFRTSCGEPVLKTRPFVLEDLTHDLNISAPTLKNNNVDHLHVKGLLRIQDRLIALHEMPQQNRHHLALSADRSYDVNPVYSCCNAVIPPYQQEEITVICPNRMQDDGIAPYLI